MAERIIISGDPGTTWTNNTDKVQYQFHAALINTCGTCLQYHNKIGPLWPIPIHYNCRCLQTLVKPEQQAPHPFTDYRELLDKMSSSDQAAAIGASNYKLLKAGVVQWSDIVTPSRVRDLREVVAKKRLSVDQMTKAGVGKRWAEEAHASVNTAEHKLVEQQRRELLQKLAGAGLSQDKIVEQLSQRLAQRVNIAEGPTGPYTEGPAWGAQRMPTPWRPSEDAAALAVLLNKLGPKGPKAAAPAAPKAAPKPARPSPPEEPVTVIGPQVEKPGEAILPKAVHPEKLGAMAIDPAERNKEIDRFVKAHPDAAPTAVMITPELRKRLVAQYERWVKSGSEKNLAEIRSILGADKIAPPIVRYGPTGRATVVDGHHRLIAYVLRGLTSIEAYVTGHPQ